MKVKTAPIFKFGTTDLGLGTSDSGLLILLKKRFYLKLSSAQQLTNFSAWNASEVRNPLVIDFKSIVYLYHLSFTYLWQTIERQEESMKQTKTESGLAPNFKWDLYKLGEVVPDKFLDIHKSFSLSHSRRSPNIKWYSGHNISIKSHQCYFWLYLYLWRDFICT